MTSTAESRRKFLARQLLHYDSVNSSNPPARVHKLRKFYRIRTDEQVRQDEQHMRFATNGNRSKRPVTLPSFKFKEDA